MIDTPYQFKSLASRVRGMHGALDADELAKLLGVAKVTSASGEAGEDSIVSYRHDDTL